MLAIFGNKNSSMPDHPYPDRRTNNDRRSRTTNPFSCASLFGARTYFRRNEDRERFYLVDRYSWQAVAAVIAIILLSVLDAVFTVQLIQIGAAREANPVMDFFLRLGLAPYLLVKYALTVGSVLVCLILKNYRIGGRIRVQWVITSVLLMYGAVIVYELSLFYRFATAA